MEKQSKRRVVDRRAWRIVVPYIVAGSFWILFSDQLVSQLAVAPDLQARLYIWKGWGFIAVTAAALFLLLRRQYHNDQRQIRHQQEQQRELLALSQFREGVIDHTSLWINVLDAEGRVLLWNEAAETISGYSAGEAIGSDRVWQWLYPDDQYREQIKTSLRRILSEQDSVEELETTVRTRERGERLISWYARTFDGPDGIKAGVVVTGLDITVSRQARKRLQARERELATIMDNLPGMAYRCLYDERWTLLFVSSGSEELTGYRPDELIRNRLINWTDIILPEDLDAVSAAVDEAIASAEAYSLEYRIRRKDGGIACVWERGRVIEEQGELILEGLMLDISERKNLEARLSELATRDSLTGQYNRRETERILEEELVRAERYQRALAVLWIDLDHFKRINDSFGHSAGDQALRTVSHRLAESIRSIDTLGRFGGEEFIVILPEMDEHKAVEAAERLRQRVGEEVFHLAGDRQLQLTVSIGVATYPRHGHSVAELCEVADRAMYQAKGAGRNRVVLAPEPASHPPTPGPQSKRA